MTLETLLFNILELGITGVIASIMYFTYYQVHSKLSYNKNFNVTIFMISLVTLVLFDAIEGNMNVSIGMLGALSIVRFRTNIKDIRDIVFVLWSLSIGIICSAGHYEMALILSAVACVYMIFTSNQTNEKTLLLVIRGSSSDIYQIEKTIDTNYKNKTVKAKNLLKDSYELVYEVMPNTKEVISIEKELFDISGVDSVNILAANTEVA